MLATRIVNPGVLFLWSIHWISMYSVQYIWSGVSNDSKQLHRWTGWYIKLHCPSWRIRYSRTSLSRTRLFRITAYLEVKMWCLFKHETMTTGNKIMWKRGEIAPKEQFLFFSTLFYIYIFLTSGVKLHIHLLNVVVQFIDFLTFSALICRGTDILMCFSESLGIRDNESRLYIFAWRGAFHFARRDRLS